MKQDYLKKTKEVLALVADRNGHIYEDELMAQLELDRDWYLDTFRLQGNILINTRYDDVNDRHFVSITPSGVDLLNGLSKPWHEGFWGKLFFLLIGAALAVVGEIVRLHFFS